MGHLSPVTLEQALAPVIEKHPLVARQAKFKARALANKRGMSDDLAGSLIAYTMELSPKEDSPYHACNSALREEDREMVLPWVDFIYLLCLAMRCLPKAHELKVYRGIRKHISELGENYKKDAEFVL